MRDVTPACSVAEPRTCKAHFLCKTVALLVLLLPLCSIAQQRSLYRDSLKKTIATGKQDTILVERLNLLAASYPSANSDTVLKLTRQAFALAQKLHYHKGAASALSIETRIYRVTGDFVTALQKGLESLKTYEKAKEWSEAAFAVVDLAQIYKDMTSDNRTAEYITTGINYAKEAFSRFSGLKDTAGMVASLNMSGILFRDKAKSSQIVFYDSALVYYNQALNLIELSGKGREDLAKLDNNISQVYLEYKKDYHKALKYLFRAVELNIAAKKFSSLSYNYGNISNAYVKLKESKNAVKFARLMVESALKENAPSRIQNAYKQMYAAFKASNQMDSALHYYILNDSVDEALTNLSKTQQVMNLQLKYETAKKESEIDRLGKEGSKQKRSIILLVGSLIFLTALAAIILWFYHRIKLQKRQIDQQAQRLQAVMKELHHRVKNNLQIVSSLLSLQTYKLHDQESIAIFKESQQRVQAMSLIHQRLYTTDLLTAVNMKEYITDLAETLLASYGFGRDDFDLHLHIEKEILDVEKALPIGLLINELVTNSLKYAYKNISQPSLTISLTNHDEHLTLLVKDNGSGIDVAEWKKKGSSFGKQLIQVLGKQLRAKQTVGVENGTAFTIVIPNKAA